MPRMPGSARAGWMLCCAHGAYEMRDRTETASELPGAAVWCSVCLPAEAPCPVGSAGKHAEGVENTMSSIQRGRATSPLVSIHPLTTPLHHHRAEVTMDVSPAGLHPACIQPAARSKIRRSISSNRVTNAWLARFSRPAAPGVPYCCYFSHPLPCPHRPVVRPPSLPLSQSFLAVSCCRRA